MLFSNSVRFRHLNTVEWMRDMVDSMETKKNALWNCNVCLLAFMALLFLFCHRRMKSTTKSTQEKRIHPTTHRHSLTLRWNTLNKWMGKDVNWNWNTKNKKEYDLFNYVINPFETGNHLYQLLLSLSASLCPWEMRARVTGNVILMWTMMMMINICMRNVGFHHLRWRECETW